MSSSRLSPRRISYRNPAFRPEDELIEVDEQDIDLLRREVSSRFDGLTTVAHVLAVGSDACALRNVTTVSATIGEDLNEAEHRLDAFSESVANLNGISNELHSKCIAVSELTQITRREIHRAVKSRPGLASRGALFLSRVLAYLMNVIVSLRDRS
jgi:hypothetical protein